MAKRFGENFLAIGGAPFVRLNRIAGGAIGVFASWVGTGGAITGMTEIFKRTRIKPVSSIAVMLPDSGARDLSTVQFEGASNTIGIAG
jgi:hypothetical protein